ncbi:hypothetical protein [Sporosarcina highlanderae]|uniref:Uncharacterized protein n=1 Tax=Sporosarcina highlanderae TaxID=3035916 RepID=A0ABT8JTU1_9BACL|nr:hypothetical protein [Sporosarcina highlanderae]MDN4608568.1 hypothetical protein [Sporosarcina highlanderae]
MGSRNNKISFILSTLFALYIVGEVVSHFIFGFSIWLFVNIPLFLISFIGIIVIMIFLIVDFFKKKERKANLVLLLVSFLLIFIMINQPFSPLLRKAEFTFNLENREEVANLIMDGEIQTSNSRGDLIPVPNGYSRSLSDGREVMKVDDKLLFFTRRGLLDSFSGYVYSPNGVEPQDEDVMAKIVKKQKMSKNWYYIACT